jgi:hypothetical protein
VQSFATEKLSYLSLEARQRKRRIYQRIEFDVMARQFVVPDTLRPDKAGEMALKIGDLLVDESDPRNMYCMEVTAIHKDAVDKRIFRASYTGEPPPNPHSRQFDLVLRLGEAHDLYAMGAVCYFILTGEHTDVRKLTNIADLLQDAPQPLRADVLTRTIPSYTLCRDLLPERFYQDELMVLILRAMVRGQPESLVSSRIERGAEPSRRFLHEIRTLYNRLTADVLAEPILRSYAGLEAAHAQQRDSHSRELAGLRQAQSSLLDRQQQASALWEKRQQRTRAIALAIALIGFGSGLAVGAQRARLLGAATVDSLSPNALAEDAKPVERK